MAYMECLFFVTHTGPYSLFLKEVQDPEILQIPADVLAR